MIDFNVLLSNILLFTALVIPGFILGKRGKLGRSAVKAITDILTDIAMPFLVFSKLLETDIGSIGTAEIICCILFPVGIVLLLFLITLALFRGKGSELCGKNASNRFCAIFSNCGFLGIPLAVAVLPGEPLAAVYVSVFNVLNTLMLLTLGIYILSGEKKHISIRRAICKPITAAVILGVIFSLIGAGEKLPSLGTYSGYLASLTTPLAMTVLGFELSELRLTELFSTKALYGAAAVKLILSPLISLAALLILRLCAVTVSDTLAAAMLISSGVSTAATAPAMAERYGADGHRAAILTMGDTVLCVLSLPLVSLVFDIFF